MISIRRAGERGRTQIEWLNSRHTFSFADYYDAAQMGFRALRVINEDRVQAGMGFPEHSHRDMEILSYVLEGEMQHADSMGNGSVIRPGEVQRMSAGTGIRHSEFNASQSEGLHFYQIWILPERRGIAPGYEQKNFGAGLTPGKLILAASPDGREGSVTIHQDANIYIARMDAKQPILHEIAKDRYAWIQVTRGTLAVNGQSLHAGDGAAMDGGQDINLESDANAEIMIFDLA